MIDESGKLIGLITYKGHNKNKGSSEFMQG